MIKERLNNLRKLLNQHKIDGYIINSKDEYLSEYVSSYAKRLEYITGFSGSNGIAIILPDICLFFTDGRYLTQGAQELDNNLFKIYDQAMLKNFPWAKYIPNNSQITFDPKLFTKQSIAIFVDQNFTVKPFENNLIDEIWQNQQPARPNSLIYDYPLKYAGEDYQDKINRCRDFLKENNANSFIISSPDSTCWLLNIRAHDIEFSPILLAFSIITLDNIYLFTNQDRLSNDLLKTRLDIEIHSEDKLAEIISKLEGKILYDENLSSIYLTNLLNSKNSLHCKDPCQLWKACKNSVEIEAMKQGHIEDGVAICEFLAFVANEDNIANFSEYDLGVILTKLRSQRSGYIMDSFPAICGYLSNGAIIHYRADKDSAKKLENQGLLLIDSGGQYLGATTDITRVALIGQEDPKQEFIDNYTKVLKGHIALALAKFPKESVYGANLDILARQYLWSDGKNYAHGTGHGVGNFLNVHEGPCSISQASFDCHLAEGMVLSNEPGYYEPDKFGIRIENMMYIKKANPDSFLEFEMLTLAPYAKDLIDLDQLTKLEKQYLVKYYENIKKNIYPLLSDKAKTWLNQEIKLL